MGSFKTLSVLLLAMVVSVVISNLYLYHKSYYGHTFLSVLSRQSQSITTSDQLLHRFDISFNMKQGELRTLDEGKITRELESEAAVNLTTTYKTGGDISLNLTEIGGEPNVSPKGNLTSSISPYQNSTQLDHNNVRAMPMRRGQASSIHNASVTPTTRKQQFFGYLLTLKVYEQQTMATGSLLQLQCFASKLNLSVVQPFMKDSSLTTPLDQLQQQHMLQLEDIYNMEEWGKYAEGEGYAPLVKWEEFMQYAPRGVILVQMRYPTLKQVKEIRGSGKTFPHSLSEESHYKDGCGYKVVEKAMKPLKRKNFHVTRRVCYNFNSGDDIPLQIYLDDLLGRHNLSNVTVIIDEWRGFGENQRLLIKENICPGSASYRDHAHTSSKVTRDARIYADKYLHQNGGTDYLAVIARFEMTAITQKREDKGDPNAVILWCIEETLREISKMKSTIKMTETFLSMDIGKYGSKSFKSHHYYGHQQDMESFVEHVYNNKMSFADWEHSFETVVEKVDTGYIAKVQQATVAQAKCVLFVGGGTFQQHALHLYQQMHPNSAEWCIKVVKKCTSRYRPITSL